ncbi:23S rRNA (uracil(1939)-C(5))-methyltransferase RlmD [Candidatus Stoquefichus massiliensis]|uniref:23S rRNA (uracil(1939)-C(5))-methyltransferase RlmD n=1 Tax=Candidatus Stoquefichus massiliensis TaxID=1470350 RepID=UPI0004871F58|nr:23S rRNA (uracil(1939)-C(5))-methyltransferase RlmD [Candidatus Stoquefichus massiliensis]
MKKNEYVEAKCIDYTHDGQGIVKIDGFPVFVKNMLIDEVGQIKIIKVLKNYAVGRLIEVYQPHPYREEPRCPLFKQCGGCHLQHISQHGQQDFKTKRVKDTLERIGHCDVDVLPCLMMENPWFYRNKVQVPIGIQNNQLVSGFYKQHSNDIIPMETCYIQNNESNQLVKRARELLQDAKETPYDKVKHTGNIRHILVRTAHTTKETMLIFITYHHQIKNIQIIIQTLQREFPNLQTIVQNINQRHDNVILGNQIKILSGLGYIEDQLLGNTYRISTQSFYQVNPIQVEHLYQKAIEYAQLKSTDEVIDAYCGIGTIALSMAKYVHKVYGVEIVEQAIIDARENAKRNRIDNVELTCQDAGEFMVEFAKKNKHIDVVMVDPPRKGCSPTFLSQVVMLSPDKIVYISCDVATQARDIAYLQEHGYHADICQPVDMFPQSYHIENIVLLVRKV